MKSPVSGELYSRRGCTSSCSLLICLIWKFLSKIQTFGPYEDINGFFNEFYDEVGLAEGSTSNNPEKDWS